MLNNIIIPYFAAEKYHLKGNDLIVFGVIWTYWTSGLRPVISYGEFEVYTNSTRQGLIKNIKHLKELGIIDYIPGTDGMRNEYKLLKSE